MSATPVRFTTLKSDELTSLQPDLMFQYIPRLDELPMSFYLFPSPQRTTRPGLPQQTRVPAAP